MRPVRPGSRARWEVVPEPRHSAAALGNDGVEVVASPCLIGFLEETCHQVTKPHYEAGEATVGVHFEMDHVGAAEIGRPVVCHAELLVQQGRRLSFAVRAEQAGRTVMRGQHGRFLIDLGRFSRPRTAGTVAPPAGTAPAELVFWFDVHSPWCYLAALRIGDLARRHKAALAWRPVHLPRLNERIGGRRPLDANPAFVAWFKQDLQDWAELLGVELRYHPDYPLRNSRALRACVHAGNAGKAEAFAQRVLRGYWGEAADISDIGVLQAMAVEVGLDPAAIVAAVGEGPCKDAVEANTEAAIAGGLFGVPTVTATRGGESKLFFGNDRLDLLERWLSRG